MGVIGERGAIAGVAWRGKEQCSEMRCKVCSAVDECLMVLNAKSMGVSYHSCS